MNYQTTLKTFEWGPHVKYAGILGYKSRWLFVKVLPTELTQFCHSEYRFVTGILQTPIWILSSWSNRQSIYLRLLLQP